MYYNSTQSGSPKSTTEIEHLFGNNRFWDNTRRKCLIPSGGPLLGSILRKRNLVVINLSDIKWYCKATNQDFDEIYAKTLAHEILHLLCIQEVESSSEGEEWAIGKTIEVKPILIGEG